jgi:hypothetical protein
MARNFECDMCEPELPALRPRRILRCRRLLYESHFTAQDPSVTIANVPLPEIGRPLSSRLHPACRVVNSFGMTRIGIPTFIMRLAMLRIAAGVCALLVRGQIAYAVPILSVRPGTVRVI